MMSSAVSFSADDFSEALDKVQQALAFLSSVSGVPRPYISLNISVGERYETDKYNLTAPAIPDFELTLKVEETLVEAEAVEVERPAKRGRKAKSKLTMSVDGAAIDVVAEGGAPAEDIQEAVEEAVTNFVDDVIEDKRANGALIPTRDEMVALFNKVAVAHPKKAAGVKELMAEFGGTRLTDISLGDWPALRYRCLEIIGG
jgi:hypothetical protein